ncbi:hypothetical protein TREMEDRAFT_28718 [Tremella mesenterica DSM 1558]|uniref:uncharacterized protein n=1 Tax=Tremella mesenterica (strain ATCC 24925 / CBS 8224 / DSM 1558 / NBRC 9311 / NRRL Y-6157 / RJB 2259-6 / UBC 559-6) TaxID=578456 RepID=UPI0003F499C0|nr:uncharacterized protein TREMEDRAFT_28718 [Tremella mesenterica DSM 1558]EIW70678.1 hypothetical protein TREMEDRAFT_28718 [Tremella mesenterica DSM 1558]
MFNRLTRLAIDLLAISTILAGVKRSTGFAPNLLGIQDPSIRTFFQRYFAIGDTIFGMISGYVVNSKYFLKTIP